MNVIVIGSQKNDIGKTLISIKLASELAKSGKKVLMMDLSAGKTKISEYLKVDEVIIYDIVDVLNTTCTPDQAIIEIDENLSLLPCPRVNDKIDGVKKEEFVNLLENLDYDYLVIDADKLTSSYLDFSIVQTAISINDNDFSCIKEINLDKRISSKAEKFILLINKYKKKQARKGSMMTYKDIEKLSGVKISSLIEEDVKHSHELLSDAFLKTEINNIINKLK